MKNLELRISEGEEQLEDNARSSRVESSDIMSAIRRIKKVHWRWFHTIFSIRDEDISGNANVDNAQRLDPWSDDNGILCLFLERF